MNARHIHTPLTIGTFIVASLTGVLMFFEIAPGGVRATHEWMSLLFVLAGLLHVYTNRRPLARYFADRTRLIIAASVAAGGVLYVSSFNDTYLAEASFQLLTRIEIRQLSTLLDIGPGDVQDKLRGLGIATVSSEQSLHDIAHVYDRDVHDLLEPLMAP